ncbi:transglutaminase-like domain-containing protein [Candidatus Woesearchaeota archaeon]|nr:transglutaminase-like domain-containing protein [Candidatus Woesearchaeota archaeon]
MEEEHEVHEDIEEEPWWKGPIKWILSIFLLLIVVLWMVPSYSVRIDPAPNYIPTIDEVVPEFSINATKHNVTSKYDFLELIDPTDPLIKQTADRVSVMGCPTNRVCHAKAIYYFVRDNFNYVSDPTKFEYVKTAKESLSVQGGDCDDSAVLLATLLEAIGVKTRLVFIPGHVFVQAYLPDALKSYKSMEHWVDLDATCRNCRFGEIPFKNLGKEKAYVE